MVSLSINSEPLKLPESTDIAIEEHNPAFDSDSIQGDYVLPFNIPYNGNARLLQFIHEVPISVRRKLFTNVEVYFKGTQIRSGILDILEVNNQSANASMRINLSGLSAIKRKLSELDLGGERTLGTTMADVIAFYNDVATKDITQTDFNLPMIHHEDFYGDTNDEFAEFINNYDINTNTFLDNTSTNQQAFVPMPYLLYVLRQGFAFDGFTLADLDYPYSLVFDKLLLYNNFAADHRGFNAGGGLRAECNDQPLYTHDTAWKQLKFNDDSFNDNYDIDNAYDPSTGGYTIGTTGLYAIHVKVRPAGQGMLANANLIPTHLHTIKVRLYIDSTLLQEKTFSGYQFIPDNQINAPNSTLLLDYDFTATGGDVGKVFNVKYQYTNNYAETNSVGGFAPGTLFRINEDYTISHQNNFAKIINLQNHVPDITFGQLLNELALAFRMAFKIDPVRKTVTIHAIENILAPEEIGGYYPKTFEGKSIYGHTIKLNNENTVRSLNYKFSGDDELEKDNFKTYDPLKRIGAFDTWTDLQTAHPASIAYFQKYAYIASLHQIFACVYDIANSDYTWTWYADAYYDVMINSDAKNDVRPDIRSLMMEQLFDGFNSPTFLVPHIKQKGSSSEFGLGTNSFSLRLLAYFWDGDGIGPMGTSTLFDSDGNGGGIEICLLWTHNTGMVKYWQRWNELINKGEIIKKNFRFNFIDLLNFDITKKIRFDNQNWFIKSMKITIGNSISEAECELLKI